MAKSDGTDWLLIGTAWRDTCPAEGHDESSLRKQARGSLIRQVLLTVAAATFGDTAKWFHILQSLNISHQISITKHQGTMLVDTHPHLQLFMCVVLYGS